jgi:predicted PurR-regulated permease PerM
MPQSQTDITRTTLAVLFIGGLIAASFWVMQPFLPAIVWAITLVIATWPLMTRVQRHVGNRRGLAVLVMCLLLLLVLIVPFWLAVTTVVANLNEIAELVRTILSFRVPPPPDWLAGVPLVGAPLAQAWARITSEGARELAPLLTPYAGELTRWFASAAGSLGSVILQLLLIVAIAAVLYANGEKAAALALRFGRRLSGDRGEMVVHLAGQAIRAVALGVVVTAIAQSVLGGIGLAVAGVPFAPLLSALMFLLCLDVLCWGHSLGDRSARFHCPFYDPGQCPAPNPDPQGSRLTAAAYPCRRHRRTYRNWPPGYFSWSDGARRRIHTPQCLDIRGR